MPTFINYFCLSAYSCSGSLSEMYDIKYTLKLYKFTIKHRQSLIITLKKLQVGLLICYVLNHSP